MDYIFINDGVFDVSETVGQYFLIAAIQDEVISCFSQGCKDAFFFDDFYLLISFSEPCNLSNSKSLAKR